jgi:hypothetical protein
VLDTASRWNVWGTPAAGPHCSLSGVLKLSDDLLSIRLLPCARSRVVDQVPELIGFYRSEHLMAVISSEVDTMHANCSGDEDSDINVRHATANPVC